MAGEEVHYHHQEYTNTYEADSDDADETLSLSDLPLYSSSSSCSKDFDRSSSSEDGTTYQDDDDDDVFEFFTGDNLASALSFQEKNIIFCGKLISCNEDDKAEIKYDVAKQQVNKLSIMRSPTKSRWQIFMMGNLFKLPLGGEMDLNDMKCRRRRRSPPPPKAVDKLWSFDGGDEEVESGQGIWKMVKTKVLGSRRSSRDQNDVVGKRSSSSIGCVPLW